MGYSESIKIFSKPWIWTAAILGTIEALAWTVLSIISICYFHGAIDYAGTSTSSYSFWLYLIFLEPSYTMTDAVVTQRTFNFFMFIYMVLSVLWLGLSAYLTWAMVRNKWDNLMNAVAGWAILTLLISVLDVILMAMVASDLATFLDSLEAIASTVTAATSTSIAEEQSTISTTTTTPDSPAIPEETRILSSQLLSQLPAREWFSTFLDTSTVDHVSTIISTTYGIVMTLAARGYILWLTNVVIAIIMIVIAVKMNKEDRPSLLPFIDAYATESRPPFDPLKGNVNETFQDDDPFGIPSWMNGSRYGNNPLANGNGYTKPASTDNFTFSRPVEEPERRPQYERVAKIGRGIQGGRRSPPQNVAPPNMPQLRGARDGPFIPDPDYTPPGSPTRQHQPKSVLRPRSNYVL